MGLRYVIPIINQKANVRLHAPALLGLFHVEWAMNIALLGPQGSGKGTQGEMLARKFDMYYLDVGSLLRQMSKTNPEIDQYVNKKGALLPDDLLFEIMKKHLSERNQYDNIVFDGYPRSKAQWDSISALLSDHSTKIDEVIVLEINEEETVRRLSARRMDPVSGHIYNLVTNPPPPEVDVEALLHREDDQPDAIRTRLAAYRANTALLIDHLKAAGHLFEVNGSDSIDTVQEKIVEHITSHKFKL